MTISRPKLDKQLDSTVFLSCYYLKEELEDFARKNDISTRGGKNKITQRIAHFLKTGKSPATDPEEQAKPRPTKISLSLDAKIGDNFRCTERHRAFFSSVITGKFHFSTVFQKYLKTHPGHTYREAVKAWYSIKEDEKKQKEGKKIEPHFKYNRYIRAFFKDNPNRNLKDAIACWNYKKRIPGNHEYDRKDLVALA